jgi:hypothetical protein
MTIDEIQSRLLEWGCNWTETLINLENIHLYVWQNDKEKGFKGNRKDCWKTAFDYFDQIVNPPTPYVNEVWETTTCHIPCLLLLDVNEGFKICWWNKNLKEFRTCPIYDIKNYRKTSMTPLEWMNLAIKNGAPS